MNLIQKFTPQEMSLDFAEDIDQTGDRVPHHSSRDPANTSKEMTETDRTSNHSRQSGENSSGIKYHLRTNPRVIRMLQGFPKSETLAAPRLQTQHSMQVVRQLKHKSSSMAQGTTANRQNFWTDCELMPSPDPRDFFRPMVGPHDRRLRGQIIGGKVWNYDVPEALREELRTQPKVLSILRGLSVPEIKLDRSFAEALDWVLGVADEVGLSTMSSSSDTSSVMSVASYASCDHFPPVPDTDDYFGTRYMACKPSFHVSELDKPLPLPTKSIDFMNIDDSTQMPSSQKQEKSEPRREKVLFFVGASLAVAVLLPTIPVLLPALAIRKLHKNKKARREQKLANFWR
ncbi:hypothetical protein K491DRAFT_715824 [Lophiostoma macrostomum CBS 122681]|uniref:Uncharacterized protein n=1 Tax=Lophiostoma macrostomum CBS 122681 TaxID=1314788 RepID=A0A6A6T9Q6_9PLEO|nr:hypothetical protein K491DRAFT_715824 [Lophiostoma macrostomum CBS 122681]